MTERLGDAVLHWAGAAEWIGVRAIFFNGVDVRVELALLR